MSEPLARIRYAYSRRGDKGLDAQYSFWKRDVLFRSQELERSLLTLLEKHEFKPLRDIRILDVGCGTGGVLRDFVRYGADPSNLSGVDLLPERIEEARRVGPHLDFHAANAADLPFEDNSFDLMLAFMMFSSITNAGLRVDVAREMLRVLRPGGALLWYDFWTNPVNRDVEALGLDEVRRLFGREPVEARRVTLAPPLARLLAPRSLLAYLLLAKIPVLRTHWLALVRV